MKYIGRMYVFQTTKNLVKEVTNVIVTQSLQKQKKMKKLKYKKQWQKEKQKLSFFNDRYEFFFLEFHNVVCKHTFSNQFIKLP